jgi:hypothetical protein
VDFVGKGNPQIRIRLPENHWIWKINDKDLRNEEIRRALDFYHNFYKDIEQIKNVTSKINDLEKEIKDIKKKGIAVKEEVKENEDNNTQGNNKSKVDPRLLNSMNKFLDF